MIRAHRSLETMSSCSGVATCLSEGSTECTLSSGTCPPCVYALSGGDFSCYSRDTSGNCPFSAAYAECDKSSSSTTKASSKSSGGSESTPASTTKAPAEKTAPPTKAPTKAPTTAPEASTSGTSSSTSRQASSNKSTSTTATSDPSTSTKTTTSSSDATQSAKTPTGSSTDSSSDGSAEKALTSANTATSGSPAVVNLALIGGAVVLAVIVIAFVARRVTKKKKKMYATQEHSVLSHNSAWSDRTLNTGNSGGNLYSTYSYKDKDNGISIMADSQASSTYGPGHPGQPGSEQRSTADFSTFGGHSQYTEDSQYYSDYSVSTGPELLAAGAVAGAQHHYANNGVPPSTRAGNNFVDVTATPVNRDSELDSMRSGQQPLTVSQLMPTAIEEDEEEAYATRRQPAHYQPSTRGVDPSAYNLQAVAVPPTSRKPQIFATSGVSDASSMRSDYDIVDPITMQDVEARNTEMLAEDSRYPKFSFESETDIYDGSSSGEESDDDLVRQGEHTI